MGDERMTQNDTPKPLTRAREHAALLIAEDDLSDEAIAAEVGVSRSTIVRWRSDPAVAARVAEHRERWREELAAEGIANVSNRVAAYNDAWDKLQWVMAARAASPLMEGVPGGETGLLVAEPMLVKVYEAGAEDEDEDGTAPLKPIKQSRIVYKYSVDVAVIRELRALGEQAAKELGQWEDKHAVSGEMLVREYIGVDPNEV